MSPVWNQPSWKALRVSSGALKYPRVTFSPRTRISPSSAIFTSTPAMGLPTAPLVAWSGWLSVTIGAVSVRPYPWMTTKPKLTPERLELRIERRGADNHRPELEAEHAVDVAVDPPPLQPVHR